MFALPMVTPDGGQMPGATLGGEQANPAMLQALMQALMGQQEGTSPQNYEDLHLGGDVALNKPTPQPGPSTAIPNVSQLGGQLGPQQIMQLLQTLQQQQAPMPTPMPKMAAQFPGVPPQGPPQV